MICLNENTEIEYLSNIRKNKIKEKNSLLKLERHREIEDSIIKDIRYIFKLQNEVDDNIIEVVRNLFRIKKKIK